MPPHLVSVRTYLTVFGLLLTLTALTVLARFAPLGQAHTVVALIIAAVKSALVLLFFMHVLYSSRLIWIVAFAGLLWLAILMVFTMADYVTRDPTLLRLPPHH
jgi:cytochrome c oxidase subunit IV